MSLKLFTENKEKEIIFTIYETGTFTNKEKSLLKFIVKKEENTTAETLIDITNALHCILTRDDDTIIINTQVLIQNLITFYYNKIIDKCEKENLDDEKYDHLGKYLPKFSFIKNKHNSNIWSCDYEISVSDFKEFVEFELIYITNSLKSIEEDNDYVVQSITNMKNDKKKKEEHTIPPVIVNAYKLMKKGKKDNKPVYFIGEDKELKVFMRTKDLIHMNIVILDKEYKIYRIFEENLLKRDDLTFVYFNQFSELLKEISAEKFNEELETCKLKNTSFKSLNKKLKKWRISDDIRNI